jgi:hypothetical protein
MGVPGVGFITAIILCSEIVGMNCCGSEQNGQIWYWK